MAGADDPHDLDRFRRAQEGDYERASRRSRAAGSDRTGCGTSSRRSTASASARPPSAYAIKGLDEARAYLDDPVLGPRLLECAEAVVRLEGRSASQVFGSPDDMKLRSCATLFACVSPPGSVFDRLLAKYYQGRRDEKTLDLLGIGPGPGAAGDDRRG